MTMVNLQILPDALEIHDGQSASAFDVFNALFRSGRTAVQIPFQFAPRASPQNMKSRSRPDRPTHFLSLRCAAAVESVDRIQQALIAHDPGLQPWCRACPPQRAHLSVLMLYLPETWLVQSG